MTQIPNANAGKRGVLVDRPCFPGASFPGATYNEPNVELGEGHEQFNDMVFADDAEVPSHGRSVAEGFSFLCLNQWSRYSSFYSEKHEACLGGL